MGSARRRGLGIAGGNIEPDPDGCRRPDYTETYLTMATSSKSAANRKSISDILIGRKLLNESQIKPAAEESQRFDKPLQQVIVDKKILEKNVVLKALSEEWR